MAPDGRTNSWLMIRMISSHRSLENGLSTSDFISNEIHENTHMYDRFTVVNTQNVHTYFVSGWQKKPKLIALADATCYVQFYQATARPGLKEMTHWYSGGRFKESFLSNGFHIIYSIILPWIISVYVPFHQMSFERHLTFIRDKILV